MYRVRVGARYPASMTLPREDDPRPPYVQAAAVLRGEIAAGRLKEGDKLPSARTLQDQYGIASSTVQNALRMLKTEGLIYTVQGRGSYVRQGAMRITSEQAAGAFAIDYTPPAWYTNDASTPASEASDAEHGATSYDELLDALHHLSKKVDHLQEKVGDLEAQMKRRE